LKITRNSKLRGKSPLSIANFRDQHQQTPYLSAPGSFAMWPMFTGTMIFNVGTMEGISGQLAPRLIAERPSGFSEEATRKAWAMVKEFMTADQWHAFHEEAQTVELTNKEGVHRLLIHRSGDFRMLKGGVGEGIEVVAGKIYESKYPLGDEMAALIALFRYDTPAMVENWRCGNFTSRNMGGGVIGEPQPTLGLNPAPEIYAMCEECGHRFEIQANSNGVPPETVTCPHCHELLEAETLPPQAQSPGKVMREAVHNEVERQRALGRLAEPNPLVKALEAIRAEHIMDRLSNIIERMVERRR